MMKWVFSLMIIFAVIISLLTGNIKFVSNCILDSGKSAINLALVIMGSMAIWGGFMRILDKSGLTSKLTYIFKPISKILFPDLNVNGKAYKAICMNITANILGLGNAATPLGIEAMQELEKEEKTDTVASRNMVMFTVLNTASIQLIPATVATLRLEYGSQEPMEILPAVLSTSLIALFAGVTVVFCLDFIGKVGNKNKTD